MPKNPVAMSLGRRSAICVGVAWAAVTFVPPPLGSASAQDHATASACSMIISPQSGPVGTLVTITGSTASCSGASAGGGVMFQDEHAGVFLGSVPTSGAFSFTYRIPASMPSGNPAAAAQEYDGGGPVGPGTADFALFMGAPIPPVSFLVTSTQPNWKDYVAIASTGSACAGCFGPGYDIFRSDGYLATFGGVSNAVGNAGRLSLKAPISAAAFTPGGGGYWMAGRRRRHLLLRRRQLLRLCRNSGDLVATTGVEVSAYRERP